MVKRHPHESGYIALIAVLIMGAVATTIGIVLLTTGSDSQRSSLIEVQSKQAKAAALSCAEEALQIIHDTTSFTGTNSLTLSSTSCSYTVTSTGSSTRTISVSGTSGNVVKKVLVYVTIGASSISVTSWQEVT